MQLRSAVGLLVALCVLCSTFEVRAEEPEANDPDFIPDLVLAAMAENPVSGIMFRPLT